MENSPTSNEIFQALQKDNINELDKYVPNQIPSFGCLNLTGLTDFSLLQDEPPLISIAVFYGSKKCLDFLINTGSELDSTDNISILFLL